MATDTDPTTPPLSLRERHRRETRDRIIDAATDLARSRGELSATMQEVAERAGVSPRTLYRYFPKRQDLVDALAAVADQASAGPLPTSLDGLGPWLAQAWQNLLDEEALIRAQHTGPAGAEVRRARVPFFRAVTDAVIDGLAPGLASEVRADIVELALLVTSSAALFECIDVLGLDPTEGARLATDAVIAMITTAQTDAGA